MPRCAADAVLVCMQGCAGHAQGTDAGAHPQGAACLQLVARWWGGHQTVRGHGAVSMQAVQTPGA
jgi:hypothetical protein